MPVQNVFTGIQRHADGTETRRPVKVWTADIDSASITQLKNTASMPFIHKWVAAMPDVHLGKGATIGSVIPTRKAIIPAAVGVDIACGMNAIRLSLHASQLPDSLRAIRTVIESRVPLGAGGAHTHHVVDGSSDLARRFDRILDKHPVLIKMQKPGTYAKQMGTLGSGNHFIEVCLDQDDRVWVMLHSGSRGVGNAIGRYFIAEAQKDMERHFIRLPDKDLAYISEGSQLFDDYWEALNWAQDYALGNRAHMMNNVLKALRAALPAFEVTDEAST